MHSKLLFETRSSTFRLHLIFEVSPFVEIRKSDREKRRTVCKHLGEIIEYTKRGVICIIRSQFCGKDAVIDCALIREKEGGREREIVGTGWKKKKVVKGIFFIYKQWNRAWKRRNYNTSFSSEVRSGNFATRCFLIYYWKC